MDDLHGAATRLFSGLDALSAGLPAEGSRIPTVRVTVEGGATLEIFRADRVAAAPVAWRVRAFTEDGVRVAAILGTNDGRAMVRTAVGPDDPAAAAVGGLVIEASSAERDMSDLSEAIAAAIRALVGPDPSSLS